MAKKLVVKTDVGTFTRSTDRTYTHLVVVKGYRLERLEAARLAEIQTLSKERAKYEAALEGRIDVRNHPVAKAWDIECHERNLRDGDYPKWIASCTERINALKAAGPVTKDGNDWSDFNPRYKGHGTEPVWAVLGWNGRLDLALKLADSKQADAFRDVRVYALDGTRVR